MYRIKYQTIEFGKTDIHLRTLRDRQEYFDSDDEALKSGISSANWSLFGIVWASEEILAHVMITHKIENLRILEIGCGTALASLVLKTRNADITATDYHPEAGNFLIENTRLNELDNIPFHQNNWEEISTKLGTFDLIIGSDLLYEANHAQDLSDFINLHANSHCQVIIVDPGRKHHAKFSKNMLQSGFSCHETKFHPSELITQPSRGADNFKILFYQR